MKKILLTLKDIFNLSTAVIYNPDNFSDISGVSIDSRNIKKNFLFVAIKGEKFDGHDFIEKAVKNGASAIVINVKKFKSLQNYDIPVITVKDTTKALGEIAKLWRKKLTAKVIGITGSAGKTTTKEILAVILSEKFKVNSTEGNNNNHIGVPLTILRTTAKHQILICELGTNHFGEIPYTANIASPDYGLITNIGDSHLEFLKDRKGVFKEKSALFIETLMNGKTIFVNNDDPLLKNFGKNTNRKITYAIESKADYKASIIKYDELGRAKVKVKSKKINIKTSLSISGEKNVINYLAAIAIASELGVNQNQMVKATAKIKSYDKRLQVKRLKDFILINDTYNANPDSMKASINLLTKMRERKRRIAILGDMFELGKESEKKHNDIALHINQNKIEEVYSIGKMMKVLDKKLNGRVKTHKHFQDRNSLKELLSKTDLKDSVVLVKGSRGMKMEEFVSVIESRIK